MKIKITERTIAKLKPPTDVAQAYYFDSQLSGFAVVVGATGAVTFIARGRVAGKKVKATIGRLGQIREDGLAWNATLARKRAQELLGEMAGGVDPNTDKRTRRGGVTLQDALDLHLAKMRKRGCSARSIETIEGEIPRLLKSWLDRPLVDLRGADLVALHDKLTKAGTKYLANRIVAHVSAVWNSADRVHELEGRNPARAVERNPYRPSRERVDELPAWFAKVATLAPIRRDLRLFALFTGMRDEAARLVRWEHLDEEHGALIVPKPKGGEAKAFTLPLAPGVLAMLKKRRRENAIEFAPWKGDAGWVFPSLSRDQKQVQAVVESKERRVDKKLGKRVRYLPGMHTSRRTFLSVASEIGISELDRHALANHAFGRQSVNATYIAQAFDHLAECAAKIETALWQRIKATPKRSRARLRAV